MSLSSEGSSTPDTHRRDSDTVQHCDVIKSGYLLIKRPPSSVKLAIRIKTWQRKYFVLRDSYSKIDEPSRLDMYNDEAAWEDGKKALFSFDVGCVTHVELYTTSEKYPNAFSVTRRGFAPLVLAAPCKNEMNDWFIITKVLVAKGAQKRESVVSTTRKDSRSHLVSSTIATSITSSVTSPPPKTALNNSRSAGSTPVTARYPRRPSAPVQSVHSVHTDSSRSPLNPPFPELHQGSPPGTITNSKSISSLSTLNLNGAALQHQKMLSTSSTSVPSTNGSTSPGLQVTVQESPDSRRNSLHGDYMMIVSGSDILLVTSRSHSKDVSWPLKSIKKFKSEQLSCAEDNLVTLEAHASCGPLKGVYLFKTRHAKELLQRVRDSVKNSSRTKNQSTNLPGTTPRRFSTQAAMGDHLKRTISEPCLQQQVRMRSPPSTSVPASGADQSRQLLPHTPPKTNGMLTANHRTDYLELVDEVTEVQVNDSNHEVTQGRRTSNDAVKVNAGEDEVFKEATDNGRRPSDGVRADHVDGGATNGPSPPPPLLPRPTHTLSSGSTRISSCVEEEVGDTIGAR